MTDLTVNIGNIITTITALVGVGAAWGSLKKGLSNTGDKLDTIVERLTKGDERMSTIEKEVTGVKIALTGITGDNGLIGRVERLSQEVKGNRND